jgi:hypothetical protein
MGRADPAGALGWIAWPLFGALAGVAATLALDAGIGRGAMAMAGLCALPLALVFCPRCCSPWWRWKSSPPASANRARMG